MNMGIIAEDDSDVAVIKEITHTLLRRRDIGVKRFVGNGCGKLRRKCGAWAINLVQQGCRWIIVVHDLDVQNEGELRANLTRAVALAKAKASVVLIPKPEIEAWLLYDGAAIARTFRQRHPPRLPGDPESLSDPKKYLRDVIWKTYRKDYLNTVHNAQIAHRIDVSTLRRSQSFSPHLGFAATVRKMIRQAH